MSWIFIYSKNILRIIVIIIQSWYIRSTCLILLNTSKTVSLAMLARLHSFINLQFSIQYSLSDSSYFTLPYLRGGQVLVRQRWGHICSAQCTNQLQLQLYCYIYGFVASWRPTNSEGTINRSAQSGNCYCKCLCERSVKQMEMHKQTNKQHTLLASSMTRSASPDT